MLAPQRRDPNRMARPLEVGGSGEVLSVEQGPRPSLPWSNRLGSGGWKRARRQGGDPGSPPAAGRVWHTPQRPPRAPPPSECRGKEAPTSLEVPPRKGSRAIDHTLGTSARGGNFQGLTDLSQVSLSKHMSIPPISYCGLFESRVRLTMGVASIAASLSLLAWVTVISIPTSPRFSA